MQHDMYMLHVHVCGKLAKFTKLVYRNDLGKVIVANGTKLDVHAVGDIDVNLHGHTITLHNVLYVPDITFNVISVKRLWKDNRIETTFGDKCYLKHHGCAERHHFEGQAGSLYKIGVVNESKSAHVTETLLHRRLGHCGINRLRLAIRTCKGLPKVNPNSAKHDYGSCDACLRGGAVHRPFKQSKKRSASDKTLPGKRIG